jgi:hypothetical protein
MTSKMTRQLLQA